MEFLGSSTHYISRHQKTMEERSREKAVKALLSLAQKDPAAMCVLINKYRQLNLHDDFEIANLNERLQAEMDRKAEQVILKNRRQELSLIASNIIGRLLGIYKPKTPQRIKTEEKGQNRTDQNQGHEK